MPEPNTRDHLANERTFLAWVRTSIALISFGVVIARLRFLLLGAGGASGPDAPHAGNPSTWLGLAFAGCGLLTLLFAAYHYEQGRRAIESGTYRADPRALYVFTGIIFLLGLASLAYLFALTRRG